MYIEIIEIEKRGDAMSDDPMQGSGPEPGHDAQMSAPAPQENFGPGFAEASEALEPVQPVEPVPLTYTTPSFYAAPPEAAVDAAPEVPSAPPPFQPGYPPYGYGAPPAGQAPYGYAPPPGAYNTVPPQGAYSYAPPAGYYAPPVFLPPAEPLPLGQAIRQLPKQYWRLLTKPSDRAFAYEQGKATWGITWVQILILGAMTGLYFFVSFAFLGYITGALLGNLTSLQTLTGMTISQLYSLIGAVGGGAEILLYPLGFFIGTGIYYLVAKAFGGEGRFLQYCYSSAIFVVPLGIVTLVLGLIPCLGSIVALAAVAFEVVLRIFMTMGVHHLKGGKATAAVLIPLLSSWALIAGGYFFYISWVFSQLPHLRP